MKLLNKRLFIFFTLRKKETGFTDFGQFHQFRASLTQFSGERSVKTAFGAGLTWGRFDWLLKIQGDEFQKCICTSQGSRHEFPKFNCRV